MQEPNMRVNALYDLAVELEYKTQHPMGRRVLGPKIDGEIADSRFGHSGLTLAAGATPSRSHWFRDDQVDAQEAVCLSDWASSLHRKDVGERLVYGGGAGVGAGVGDAAHQ
jgi:hypothetical protein